VASVALQVDHIRPVAPRVRETGPAYLLKTLWAEGTHNPSNLRLLCDSARAWQARHAAILETPIERIIPRQ
jgi:hypothetical protein